MSYSRWKDERYFPAFRDAFIAQHSRLDAAGLDKAREYNAQRYYFQGIGRYPPDQAYARGVADLTVLADLVPASGYVHGAKPTGIDAGIYGFVANLHYYPIPTPLSFCVSASEPGAPLRGHSRGRQPVSVERPQVEGKSYKRAPEAPYGHFKLVSLCRLEHDVPRVKA
jgi:hypothetical protein